MSQFNYIKAHRMRWRLSQKELGFLLGYGDNSHISRIEQGKLTPNREDIIRLEMLFGNAGCRLFPDLYSDVTDALVERLGLIEEHLNELPSTKINSEKRELVTSLKRSIAQQNDERI